VASLFEPTKSGKKGNVPLAEGLLLIADTNQEMAHPKHLTDAMIDATFEIMAEEGAIWSGAR
jgi:hypothetical protein